MTQVSDRTDGLRDPRPSRPLLHVEVERRPADGRDLGFLRELFADTHEDLLLTPDTRDLIVDMQFRAQQRAWRLDHPEARRELLVVRGVRAGTVVLDRDPATIHVVDLVVRSGLRGLGIGTDLMTELAHDADRTGRTITLRVGRGNHAARRFFERCGLGVGAVVGGHHEMFRPPAES